jgi:hypothetical protein
MFGKKANVGLYTECQYKVICNTEKYVAYYICSQGSFMVMVGPGQSMILPPPPYSLKKIYYNLIPVQNLFTLINAKWIGKY